MTIERLIKGCQQNDRKCQKALYLQYCKLAIKISLRYAKDDHEAKDIVHNSFLKIFDKINSFDSSRGDFKNWMSRIVINEALQLYRKNKLIDFKGEDYTVLDSTVDPPIIEKLQAEDILNLLRQLPDGYRLVFVLAVIEGYKHGEIAMQLDITESASRSQLARAKKMMRHLITKQNSLEYAAKVVK